MRRIALILFAVLGAGAGLLAQGPVTPVAPALRAVYQGNTPLAPQHVLLDIVTSGDQVVINESSGKRICLLAAHLTMTGTAVTIRFESTGGGSNLTGQMGPSAGQTIVLSFNPACWVVGNTSMALAIELSGGQSVDGSLTFAYVNP